MKKNMDNKCIICWCTKFHHKYYWSEFFYGTTTKTFEIIQCDNCKLEQLFPIPTKDEQLSFYPKNYYSYNKKVKGSKLSEFLQKWIDFIFSIFKNKKFELPEYDWKWKTFLDIGCGDWFNLEILNNIWGWKTKWFEISDNISYKNNIYYWKSIVDVNFNEKYDYIWCHHVFEHVDNPIDFLNKVHSLLTDDWAFVLTLPNVKNFMSTLFGQYASDRDVPRHIYGYWYKNIQQLLKNTWFDIVGKKKKPQTLSWTSFSRFLIWKYGIDIRWTFLMKIVCLLFLPFDFIFTLFKETNQMSFILKKID